MVATVTVETSGGMSSSFSTEDLNRIINILGKRDIRMFLPLFESDPADNEAMQDLGPRGHHFSKHTTSDNDPYIRGQPLAYRLNGTDEAIDMADNADFSFGDGATDEAFSVGCAVKFDSVGTYQLIARMDDDTPFREWQFFTDAAGDLTFKSWDNFTAGGAQLGRQYDTSVVIDQWYIAVGTYDGSSVEAGYMVYLDGVRVDDTTASAGVYTAMGDQAIPTIIGAQIVAGPVYGSFFPGGMALPFITARELSAEDVLRLTNVYRRVLGL